MSRPLPWTISWRGHVPYQQSPGRQLCLLELVSPHTSLGYVEEFSQASGWGNWVHSWGARKVERAKRKRCYVSVKLVIKQSHQQTSVFICLLVYLCPCACIMKAVHLSLMKGFALPVIGQGRRNEGSCTEIFKRVLQGNELFWLQLTQSTKKGRHSSIKWYLHAVSSIYGGYLLYKAAFMWLAASSNYYLNSQTHMNFSGVGCNNQPYLKAGETNRHSA